MSADSKLGDAIAPKTGVVAPKSDVVAPQTGVVAPKSDVVAPQTGVVAPKSDVVASQGGSGANVEVSNDQPIEDGIRSLSEEDEDDLDFGDMQGDDPQVSDPNKKPFNDGDDLLGAVNNGDVVGTNQDSVDSDSDLNVETEETGSSASSLTFASILLVLSFLHSFV